MDQGISYDALTWSNDELQSENKLAITLSADRNGHDLDLAYRIEMSRATLRVQVMLRTVRSFREYSRII